LNVVLIRLMVDTTSSSPMCATHHFAKINFVCG
jgi:hypothetical protein